MKREPESEVEKPFESPVVHQEERGRRKGGAWVDPELRVHMSSQKKKKKKEGRERKKKEGKKKPQATCDAAPREKGGRHCQKDSKNGMTNQEVKTEESHQMWERVYHVGGKEVKEKKLIPLRYNPSKLEKNAGERLRK